MLELDGVKTPAKEVISNSMKVMTTPLAPDYNAITRNHHALLSTVVAVLLEKGVISLDDIAMCIPHTNGDLLRATEVASK